MKSTPSSARVPTTESVCAVVVTHNRRDLLAESLTAVLGQTRPPDAVIVVDNVSTDGTREMLAERFPDVDVVTLARNEGASGGFHEGIRLAHERGHDQIWLMDDDTVPAPDALESLLQARRNGAERAAFVASKVVWTDGNPHPMNRPHLTWKDTDLLMNNVASGNGLLPVRALTWVSLLLDRGVVDRHGLPDKRYFLWSEDIEYTSRITAHDEGFIATHSVAVHKTPEPHTHLTSSGERFYFHVRNTIYLLRSDAWTAMERVSLLRRYLRSLVVFLRREGFRPRAIAVVARGVRDGLMPPEDPAGPYVERD